MSWGNVLSGGLFPTVLLRKTIDRRDININSYENYNVNLYGTVDGSGLPISLRVPWQNNINSRFSNIRFFQNNKPVPFYIESVVPNSYALVHIKPQTIVNGVNTDIKMVVNYEQLPYNPYSFYNTYQYFEHATSYNPKYIYDNLANLTFTSDGTRIRYTGSTQGGMNINVPVLSNSGIVEFLYKHPTSYRNRILMSDKINGGTLIGLDYGVFSNRIYWGGNYETTANNTWYRVQFILDGTSMVWKLVNPDTGASVSSHTYTGATIVKTLRYLNLRATESTSSDYYVKDIVVRDLGTPPYWAQIDCCDRDNCLLDMPMDVISGSTIYDIRPSLGTSNNGTLISMSQSVLSEGKIGKCIKSSADASVITLTSSISDFEMFISFWYYGTSVARVRTLFAADATHQHACLNTSSHEIGFWNGGFVGSGFSLTSNTWQHILIAKQQNTQQIYVNGTLVMNVDTSFNNADYPLLYIGNTTNSSGTLGMNGRIDQLRVFRGIPTTRHFNILPYI